MLNTKSAVNLVEQCRAKVRKQIGRDGRAGAKTKVFQELSDVQTFMLAVIFTMVFVASSGINCTFFDMRSFSLSRMSKFTVDIRIEILVSVAITLWKVYVRMARAMCTVKFVNPIMLVLLTVLMAGEETWCVSFGVFFLPLPFFLLPDLQRLHFRLFLGSIGLCGRSVTRLAVLTVLAVRDRIIVKTLSRVLIQVMV